MDKMCKDMDCINQGYCQMIEGSEDDSCWQEEWDYYQLEGQRMLRNRWVEKAGKTPTHLPQRLPEPEILRKSEGNSYFKKMVRDLFKNRLRIFPFEGCKDDAADALRYSMPITAIPHDVPVSISFACDEAILMADAACPFGLDFGKDYFTTEVCKKECLFITSHSCRHAKERLTREDCVTEDFSILKENRMVMGAFRHGLFGDTDSKPEYDRVNAIIKRAQQYQQTGNDELLVDIANLAELEFEEGKHPDKHFHAQDDKEHTEVI